MTVRPNEDISDLFPKGWLCSPREVWKVDGYGALVFFRTNLILGSIGLWWPYGYAWLNSKSLCAVTAGLLGSGALYMFVIPFLAATSAMVTEESRREREKTDRIRRWQSWAQISGLLLIICAICLPIQLAAPQEALARNYAVQVVVSLFGVVLAVYMFSMLRVDLHGSVADDVKNAAEDLGEQAKDAVVDKGAFDNNG